MALLVASTVASAGTLTTNYNLNKPADGEHGWGALMRANSDTIDTELKRVDDLATAAASFDEGTATSGSTTTLGDSTKSWGVNSLAGMDLSVKRAGATIRTEPIISNTSNAITFASGTAVAAADTYQVFASGAASRAPRGNLPLTVSTGTYVLTDPDFDNSSFDLTGTLVANVTVQVPNGFAQIFVVDNETTGSYSITVKHAATSGVVVPQGKRVVLYTTGTVVEDITQSGAAEMTRNEIHNGQMRVAQAGTSFAAVADGDYDVDGWLSGKDGTTAVWTIAQATGSDTGKLARTLTVTTADAAVAAGDAVTSKTKIEGYDVVKYLGNTFTLGFRVKSAVTGIHTFAIYDGTSSYLTEYTINSANTWEYKSATIVGGLQAAASTTNSMGIQISFASMCGSTWQATAGTWGAGIKYCTASQVNDVATVSNVFALEDVTMNLGTTVAPDTATYEQDLARAQRYYETQSKALWSGDSTNTGTYRSHASFLVTKRASPTMTFTGISQSNFPAGSPSLNDANIDGVSVFKTANGTGASSFYTYSFTAAARL